MDKIAVTVCVFVFLLTSCHPQPTVEQSVAQVERVRSTVTVVPFRGSVRSVASVLRLAPQDVVRTDSTGRAILSLDGGDRFVLDHDTTVRVSGPRTATLESGRLWISTVDRRNRNEETTLSVAETTLSIRDARASVEFSSNSKQLTLFVLSGTIAYQSGTQRGAVRTGESARIHGSQVQFDQQFLFEDWTGGLADDVPETNTTAAAGLGSLAAREPSETGAPRWPMILRRLDIQVVVRGDQAITTVDQTFFNPSFTTVEGLYTFQTPIGAVLQSFAVDRRGRMVEGTARERRQAARQYQERVYTGSAHDPALLEWDAPGRYHARIYPIPPGSTRRIRVRYSQWLAPDSDGRRVYRLPLASLDTRIGELRADFDLEDANVTTVRTWPGAHIEHGHLYIAQNDVLPRADLVVELQGNPAPEVSAVRVAAPMDPRGGFVRVAVRAPDPIPHDPHDQGMDLVIVVDHSAGTDSHALRLQQTFVESILQALDPRDHVLVLAGDVTTRPVGFPDATLREATARNRQSIVEALARDRPGGATDLAAMITAAHQALRPDRNGAIVYVGDGKPTVGDSQLPDLRQRLSRLSPRPRVYAVAVGEDPQMDLLTGLTEPAGFATRLSRQSEVASTVMNLLAHASRPLIRNFHVDFGPLVQAVYPSEPVDVPAGEPLVVVGRYASDLPMSITVRAMWNGRPIARTVPLLASTVDDGGDLRVRWATLRLEHLLARGESRPVIVELGTRFNLVTPFTSLYVPSEYETRLLEEQNTRALRTRQSLATLSPWDLLPLVGCTRAERPTPEQTLIDNSSQSEGTVRSSRQTRNNGAPPEGLISPFGGPGGGLVAGGAGGTAARRVDPFSGLTESGLNDVSAMGGLGASNSAEETSREDETGWEGLDLVAHGYGPEYGGTVGLGSVGSTSPAPQGRGSAPARSRRPLVIPGRPVVEPIERSIPSRNETSRSASSGTPSSSQNETFRVRATPSNCSDAAALPLSQRIELWRERVGREQRSASEMAAIYRRAREQCEVPHWADRVTLLRIVMDRMRELSEKIALYHSLSFDPAASRWARDTILGILARTGELAQAENLGLGRIDPTTLAALLSRATTASQRLNILREMCRRYPDDIELALRLLEEAVSQHRVDDVRATVSRLRAHPSADARVRTAAGEALFAIGDESEARRTFSEIVEFAPDDPVARRRLGDIALAHGWSDEAYRQFQILAKTEHDAPDVLLRLAMAARMAGRMDEAIRLAERVAEQSVPGSAGDVAAAWIGIELALASQEPGIAPDVLRSLKARWRSSPAARASGAVRTVLRWYHPDDTAELWLTLPGEDPRRSDITSGTIYFESTVLADAPSSFTIEVRRGTAARPRGKAELLVVWYEGTERETVQHLWIDLDDTHPRYVFTATPTSLVPITTAATTTEGGAR